MEDIPFYYGRFKNLNDAKKSKSDSDRHILKAFCQAKKSLELRGWDKNGFNIANSHRTGPCRLDDLIDVYFYEECNIGSPEILNATHRQAFVVLHNAACKISRPYKSRSWKNMSDWESRRKFETVMKTLDLAIQNATRTYINEE